MSTLKSPSREPKAIQDIHVSYDRSDPREIRIRNPLDFVDSIRCPLRLYVGDDARWVNKPLAAKARQAGKDCELVDVKDGHQEMVASAVQSAISWFRQIATK